MAAPKLRFREFDVYWNSVAIGNFLKIKSGLGFKAEEYTTEEAIRLLQIENVGYGTVKWTHNVKFVPHNYLENHQDLVLNEDDIVLALNRPVTNDQLKIAKLTKQDSPSILYQRVGKLEFKKNEIDSGFIFQIFQKDVKNYVLNSSIGSDQPFISTTHLYKHKLHIPSKPEQTKIASFLSAVDEKISQLTQKHELLSQYKQGMMQKLFSQQIRFKADDGSEFGEWEETTLDNFLTESLVKGNKGDEARKLTVKLWGKGVIPKNEAFQGSENTQYYRRSAGQLIYGKLDFLNCAFGIIPQHLDGFESTIDAPAFNIDQSVANPYFLLNRFFQKDFYKKNGEEADGSRKAKRINQSVFLAMTIQLPCIQEQTKIANFLSAIDQKIEVVAQQIEQAKTWKKGLLQQMFV
ncbi:restriction endonuclease subunit S [Acinetobacter sp. HR7]|uniref:restriction endonuclease subunit S n=2 Tax=Moraxellaceae TaxID=468 RepID=UPI0005366010|nr:restriction endonuclease subunit S [Acinetobacter sp. HR7]KGT47560.1 hypothetical protein GW12_13960 [Acinetobacter sp. HR7]